MTKGMITYAFNSAKKINMDKKSQFLYQFRAFLVNSNSIPIPFFSIPIPSPIPGIESGIELNSHSIPELTPTLAPSSFCGSSKNSCRDALMSWVAVVLKTAAGGSTAAAAGSTTAAAESTAASWWEHGS